MCAHASKTEAKEDPSGCCCSPEETMKQRMSDPRAKECLEAFTSFLSQGMPECCQPPAGEAGSKNKGGKGDDPCCPGSGESESPLEED